MRLLSSYWIRTRYMQISGMHLQGATSIMSIHAIRARGYINQSVSNSANGMARTKQGRLAVARTCLVVVGVGGAGCASKRAARHASRVAVIPSITLAIRQRGVARHGRAGGRVAGTRPAPGAACRHAVEALDAEAVPPVPVSTTRAGGVRTASLARDVLAGVAIHAGNARAASPSRVGRVEEGERRVSGGHWCQWMLH
jgi:hypothetical protein